LFSADRSDAGTDCCSSWSASFFRSLSGGYYWTDNLKTELEYGWPGPTEGYGYSNQQLGNRTFATVADERTYSGTKLSVAQAYQFGHNVPFHPYAFAGVDVDRERVDLERRIFSSNGLFESVETSRSSQLRARGFTGAGFKAYVSERAFFKGEMKLDIGDRLSQAIWKAGVGIDFPAPRRLAATTLLADKTAAPLGRDPVDVWRAYAVLLPVGSIVDVVAVGENRVTAELLSADDTGVLVKPQTRVREPTRRIRYERLEELRLHVGPSAAERFGAAAAGVGTGSGVFFGVLAILISAFLD
jgi:hypothetical protein